MKKRFCRRIPRKKIRFRGRTTWRNAFSSRNVKDSKNRVSHDLALRADISFRNQSALCRDIQQGFAQATNGKAENYALSTLDLENSRQSISGVDLNDEATSMMQFSKSYSAACRLLTTIDSMLDTLINGTAR